MNIMAILAAAVCYSTQTASVSRMHDEDVWPWRIPSQHSPTKRYIAVVPARGESRPQHFPTVQ